MTQAKNGSNTGTIVVRRTIPATVDELFDAWLDPESLAQWMHPGSTARSTAKVDARVGGAFEVIMHSPNKPLRHYGEYRHIERNKKLTFSWISDATHHMETLVTVEFNIAGAGTEIVLTHERIPDHEAGKAHAQGWALGFELLENLVAPKPFVLATFDWVPEMPRGFVRDIRVRWALEEAGLPYRVQSVPSLLPENCRRAQGRLAISTELRAANSHSRVSARPCGSAGSSAVLRSPRCSRMAPVSNTDVSPSVSHGTWPKG